MLPPLACPCGFIKQLLALAGLGRHSAGRQVNEMSERLICFSPISDIAIAADETTEFRIGECAKEGAL